MGLPKIITIVGTNASGKSALGIALARAFGGEIISADSRQVYAGFDLCCGKVTAAERALVAHHMLDERNLLGIGADEFFTVYDFQQRAYGLIGEIMARGCVPFVVGGTGQYVESVARGYVLADGVVDAVLRAELDELSVEELQERLTAEAFARLSKNASDFQNKRRLVRAIEKAAQGEPLAYENAARYEVLQLGVTWPKEMLHARIDERLDARIDAGMIDEVRAYLDAGGDEAHLHRLGLEYRYVLWYVQGRYKSLGEFKADMARAIKRFAKRQMTWFRRDAGIRWIDMRGDYMAQAAALVEAFLA